MTGDAPDIGVVQVEITEAGAIGECGEIGRDMPLRADDGRPAAAARQHHVAANTHGFLVEGRNTAAKRVNEMHFDAFDGGIVEIVIAQTVGIGGEPFRERSFARRRDRRCRTIFRPCNSRSDRQDSRASGEMQKLSAWKFHCDLPQLNLRQAEPGPQAALSVSNNRVAHLGRNPFTDDNGCDDDQENE